MQKTTHYGYNVPEPGDPADITKVSDNFNKIDEDLFQAAEASRNFDMLASTYGYTMTKEVQGTKKIYTETVKEGSPVTANRVTTKEVIDGVKTYTTVTTIGEDSITLMEKKTDSGFEGSVI